MKINYSDHLEEKIGKALEEAGINFIHESQPVKSSLQRLDFYLPDYNIYIEVKQYPSPRTAGQLTTASNVILIQGVNAVVFFINNLRKA